MNVAVPEAGDNGLAGAIDDARVARECWTSLRLPIAVMTPPESHNHRIGERRGVGRRVDAASDKRECLRVGDDAETRGAAEGESEKRGAEQIPDHTRIL